MRKMMNDKLALNRETLHRLNGLEMSGVAGGQTGFICSNPSDSCVSCYGPSCNNNPTTTTGTSACC
jgi:hypothetical protein